MIRLRRFLARHPRLYWPARRGWRALRRLTPGAWSEYWDRSVAAVEAGQTRGWLDWEIVEREVVRPRISGDIDIDYLRYFVASHLEGRPAGSALSLGCGGGNLERGLIGLGLETEILGLDASEESIVLASRLAEDAGMGDRLRYRVADLETADLGEARFDFVVAKMALHHLGDLEGVAGRIARSLRPGGVLMFNEFVGPDYFQWTTAQLEHANALLRGLPSDLRRRLPFPEVRRPTVAEMLAEDPTESIRSSEIPTVFGEVLEIVERRPYGGTLLHLLGPAFSIFDLDDARDLGILRSWFEREEVLLDASGLPSDFLYAVARRRPA